MDLSLRDRVVAVAGSSRGIGLAIARAALDEGALVVISGRNPVPLEEARSALAAEYGDKRVHAVLCDLADEDGARTFIASSLEQAGGIDALVVNAGSGAQRPGWNVGDDEWRHSLEANLWPVQRVLAHGLPVLVGQRRGSVVLVASITGLESTPAPLVYGAVKAAVVNYAKNLARQLGPEGVRVNCVAPGNVLFPGGRWQQRLDEDPDGVRALLDAEVPLRRFGSAEEVADAVLFLLSDRAAFVTGACLVVDGGQTRGIH
jgi:3-oxoacyl-[acyl-carrier protein] reductase